MSEKESLVKIFSFNWDTAALGGVRGEEVSQWAQTAEPSALWRSGSLPVDLWDLWVVFEQRGRLDAALSCICLAQRRLPLCLCEINGNKNIF